MNTKIKSPITNTKNTKLIRKIKTKNIISSYKKDFNLDVSNLFKNIQNIQLLKCKDSGFLFFYPFTVDGDGLFYEKLSREKWYYMDTKYEHKIVEQIIKKEKPKNLLEIGCGNGSFVKKISSQKIKVTGLEINKNEINKNQNFEILDETIEKHSENNKGKYDIVASFQVLEHIKNPMNFINSSLDTLKKNGLMIISVPNNDSFIKRKKDNVLNMPPHHMGKWNIKSLLYIAKLKNLEIEDIIIEPLQDYHINWYLHKDYKKFYKKIIYKIKKIIYKITIKKIYKDMIGHSIIFVYRKNK